ncbi:uncharacterized protein LOC121793462 [Salvia splendens]|uniref:uncharacterized protein LOC121793462 n=1 Tax=Salvia splendens TaxID=180675 RepID=UPI001C281096|nr:uncharacterized protein LOC121793462 [Salvia splendens]XP_042047402.1 uncharacterized protein LOC121793462 [Salvia splendens]XP_042047403.1 uncharacterized protein LOC121793462 [Salvia splendens]XP_042047404.1 uncharacterized protein LOC121793462 [Salvia splendens]XP_042047405.1 uncharacterized protein LOC121793462 [Salvia splendens]XP_042047406.1 uncharacterized protein LOC121793462 [Salvia splendens]XP_042047407.1 uncharacterized protein LOC121793462 [Salvia splendens]
MGGFVGGFTVLRDAVTQEGGLKVPQGCYYLCDNGYANSNGFLTPYKGVRYHLKEWGPGNAAPQIQKELFNMRHMKARNLIERAFAVLKMSWGILRCASYYPIKTQIRIILACFLLHEGTEWKASEDYVKAKDAIWREMIAENDFVIAYYLHDEPEYGNLILLFGLASPSEDDMGEVVGPSNRKG